MDLQPSETELVGAWTKEGDSVRADPVCERIEILTSRHLEMVATSSAAGGWETLYRDPLDGRYWEKIYPQSGLHGGGPPTLRVVPIEVAEKKYELR